MGLFADYLDTRCTQTLRKAKKKAPEETKEEASMAEFAGVMTLDGEPPNGAVPPGALLLPSQQVEELPPHGGMPVRVPTSNQPQTLAVWNPSVQYNFYQNNQ